MDVFLEHVQLYVGFLGVDITFINTPTIELADNPRTCYVVKLFTPNDEDQSETSNAIYFYPDAKEVYFQGCHRDITPLETLFRENGYTDHELNTYTTEII